MKRIVGLSCLGAALLIGGCSAGSSGTGSGESKDVTLTIGMWSEEQAAAYEPVIEKFQEENPSIKVDLQPTPWDQYWTKLETAATGSSLPDVFWMNGPNVVKYASNGILLPLDEYLSDSNVDMANYPEALVELYKYENEHFGIPKDFDTVGLFYNKELFDAAGVEYPDSSWNWDSLVDAAKELTNVEEGVYGIAAKLNNQVGYYNTIYQAGGEVISEDLSSSGFDNPKTLEGLKFWTDLIHEHKVSPTIEQMNDNDPRALLESGKVAMLYDGSWMAGVFGDNELLKGNIDVAELPAGEQKASIIHGVSHVIGANTEHPEEAWQLLEYLSSEEANQMFSESGMFIPAFNGTQDAWVDAHPEMNLQVFIDTIEYALPYPTSVNTTAWQDQEYTYFTRAWSGAEEIDAVAQEFSEEMNSKLDAE